MKPRFTHSAGEERLIRFAEPKGKVEAPANRMREQSKAKTLRDTQEEWAEIQTRINALVLHFRDNPTVIDELTVKFRAFKKTKDDLEQRHPEWKMGTAKTGTEDADAKKEAETTEMQRVVNEQVAAWKRLRSQELEPWLEKYEQEVKIAPPAHVLTPNDISEETKEEILPKKESLRRELGMKDTAAFNHEWQRLYQLSRFQEYKPGMNKDEMQEVDRRNTRIWNELKQELLALITRYEGRRIVTAAGRPDPPAPFDPKTRLPSLQEIRQQWATFIAPRIDSLGTSLTPEEKEQFKASMRGIDNAGKMYFPKSNKSLSSQPPAEQKEILEQTGKGWLYVMPLKEKLISDYEKAAAGKPAIAAVPREQPAPRIARVPPTATPPASPNPNDALSEAEKMLERRRENPDTTATAEPAPPAQKQELMLQQAADAIDPFDATPISPTPPAPKPEPIPAVNPVAAPPAAPAELPAAQPAEKPEPDPTIPPPSMESTAPLATPAPAPEAAPAAPPAPIVADPFGAANPREDELRNTALNVGTKALTTA